MLGGEPGGDATLLLHGFGADRLSWVGIAPGLANRSLVLAVDLPGHGGAAGEPFTSFDALVETLGATLDADPRWHEATGRHLVGHSFGAAVALALAARADRAPDSVALLAPPTLARDVDVAWLADLVALEDVDAANRHLARLVENPRLMPAALGPALVGRLGQPGVRATLERIVRTIEDTRSPARDADVETLVRRDPPRLVVWGERDAIARPDPAALARFGGRLETLPRCAHLPHVERRRETGALLDELQASASR